MTKLCRVRPGLSTLVAAVLVVFSMLAGCAVSDRVVTVGDGGVGAQGGNLDGSVDGGSGSGCIPDTNCNPTNLCHEGQTSCVGAAPSCRDTNKARANGSSCEQGSVCQDGTCKTCADEAPCALPDKPCRVGSTVCATGAPVCTESDNRPNGAACGNGMVCEDGACGACMNGGACVPASVCHVGVLDCSTPTPTCTDTGSNVMPGTVCGKGNVCSPTAECVPCVAESSCMVAGKPCRNGTTACNTGVPVCIESGNVENGMACGTGNLCSGGACIPCTDGLSCVPVNPCHEGASACTPTLGCNDNGKSLPDGTSCGTDKVCSSGACNACAAGKACQVSTACKTGIISCSTGLSVCTANGSQPDGTSCGMNQVCSKGTCVSCSDGASCTPSNPCHNGTLACTTGTPVCNDVGTSLANGTMCGTDLVCHTGACVTCAASAVCQPANSCKTGATSCTTGLPVCTESGNKAPGTSCGAAMVCDNSGACVACNNGASCAPSNPCHSGTLSCSTGASLCTDSGNALANGTACGTNLVCSGGGCVTCTSGLSCQPANACKNGTTACSTGQSVCTESGNKPVGSSCGVGAVCNAAASCVSCNAGSACTPGNACHKGTITCNTGAPVCTDSATNADDGTMCGTNLYCLSGNCQACTPNQSCQPGNLCKNGSTSCATGASSCNATTNKPPGTSCGPGQSCANNVKTAASTCDANGQCTAPTAQCTNGCNLAGTDCLNCNTSLGEAACNGVCCTGAQACCNGACVDITNNPNACGSCSTTCTQGAVCRTKGCVSNASCRTILATGHSTGSASYTIDPDGAGPIPAFGAYCDMTTNGGGYTLVVGIDATNRNHTGAGAVTPGNLTVPSGKGKFADDVIRAILSTGSTELRFDVASTPNPTTRTWIAPTCVWDSTAATCANHCGPDNPCIYAQPVALGLYMEVGGGSAIYSYASAGCGGSVSTFTGVRNWQGNECGFSTALAGTVWVR